VGCVVGIEDGLPEGLLLGDEEGDNVGCEFGQ
jgi:hypothetical protein